MTPHTLPETLRQALSRHRDGALCVAFSGGPDSSALLHALATLPAARARHLRAVHVDHGLNPDSQQWAMHCREVCQRLDIPFSGHAVKVDRHSGTGIEAAARDARYAVFAHELQARESLLTAHHREDQAETVLLKLMRGAGPQGLGGMRERRPLAAGCLWRPLLETPQSLLHAYVEAQGLDCIHDPSNQSPKMARNFLRTDILPQLNQRWPRTNRAITHSARLNRQTADFLAIQANQTLQALRDSTDHSLDAQGWLALHPALHMPVLEQWLHELGLAAPGQAHCAQLRRQIDSAVSGRVPLVRWPGTAVHVWRQRLHAHAPLPEAPVLWHAPWHGSTLDLPAAAGSLHWHPSAPATVPTIDVRLGETGVRLRPAGDTHTRELRDLFQQISLPPWRRRHCPLLYSADGTLLCVADLWQTQAGKDLFTKLGSRPSWTRSAS